MNMCQTIFLVCMTLTTADSLAIQGLDEYDQAARN